VSLGLTRRSLRRFIDGCKHWQRRRLSCANRSGLVHRGQRCTARVCVCRPAWDRTKSEGRQNFKHTERAQGWASDDEAERGEATRARTEGAELEFAW
jgi:hypothetical protein